MNSTMIFQLTWHWQLDHSNRHLDFSAERRIHLRDRPLPWERAMEKSLKGDLGLAAPWCFARKCHDNAMTSIYWQLLTYINIIVVFGTPSWSEDHVIPMDLHGLSLPWDGFNQAFRREGHGVAVLLIRCAHQRATIVAWLAIWPAIKGAWRCSWVAWLDVTRNLPIFSTSESSGVGLKESKIRIVAKIHSSVFSPQGQSWSFGQHLSVPLK